MRRTVIIILFAIILFLIELVFFHIFGRWFTPNFFIIFVVFVNLYLGIRWSLVAAFICGIIQDSFSVSLFGINTFSFVICAYMTTIIVKNHYQVGSIYSRMMTIFIIAVLNVFIHYMINVMYGFVQFGQMVSTILIPEVFATIVVAPFCFKKLKKWAVKHAF